MLSVKPYWSSGAEFNGFACTTTLEANTKEFSVAVTLYLACE